MMDKIKVAVVGIGHVGSIHAKIYSQIKGVELAAVCDIDIKKAKRFALKYNVKYSNDYHSLFNFVDAVSITVPTSLHYKIAKEFLKNGIHTLIEKPITTSLKEADELLNIAKKKKLIIQVGHVERFNSAIIAIKKLPGIPKFIECHRIGPFSGRGIDVSVVLDLMIHDIDIILDLVLSPIRKIEAIGAKILSNKADIANARIFFKNGTVSNLTASRVSEDSIRKIRIFKERSYISLDYVKQEALIYRKLKNKIKSYQIPIRKEAPLKAEINSFIECVKYNKQPIVSGKEARKALKLALDIENMIKK
jgi:predicted dehydrogenase